MKFIRYQENSGNTGYAVLQDKGKPLKINGDIFRQYEVTAERIADYTLLAPVFPAMILCIGANYNLHIKESNAELPKRPLVFMKGINSLQHPGKAIRRPDVADCTELDYEGELAVVIGKTCLNVSAEDALNYVFGYTCANDISARDWQLKWGEGQWARGKSFDTFCPLGPCLVSADEIPDPQNLSIKTTLNGITMQQGNTSAMLFDIRKLISFLSQDNTLPPRTVILTGTPEGVGMAQQPPLWLKPGDEVCVEISGIGKLSNPVTGN